MEFLEAADLAGGRIGLEAGRGARLQAADVALQRAGGSQAEDIVEAIRLAPVEHFRAGIVAVGAQQDLHLRPGGADRADQAPQKGTDFDALRPLRRAQDGGDEATILVEDDDRLEAGDSNELRYTHRPRCIIRASRFGWRLLDAVARVSRGSACKRAELFAMSE